MRSSILILFLTLALSASAQSVVQVNYDTGAGTPVQQVEAVIRQPQGTSNNQAVLILHHAGGFSFNTTTQYAEFFSKQGFFTLELKMFHDSRHRPDPTTLHGQVMGGLKYLATTQGVDSKKVSAMGMSLGAFLTIDATSSWFYEHYQAGGLRFDKLVALYPVCWFMTEANKGQTQGIPIFNGLPNTFLQQSAAIPLLVLGAGKDSYDSSDAEACPTFAKTIADPRQAALTQVVVYPNATHGWDHGRNYNFPVRGGCTGRTNCTNYIVSSPETVELGKHAVLSFLTAN